MRYHKYQIRHRVESETSGNIHPSLATGYSTESADVLPSETTLDESSVVEQRETGQEIRLLIFVQFETVNPQLVLTTHGCDCLPELTVILFT